MLNYKYISHFVSINALSAVIDGKKVDVVADKPDALLLELYKGHVGDYPKFHKMDPLCKLGFVASELLLNAEGVRDRQWGEHRGVVLFSASGSLADDCNFQKTIEGEDPFPSPSLFVYTLPNVVTGEISIRNHFYGESNCYVLPSCDARQMAQIIASCFCDSSLQSLVTGWIDCTDENHFNATMFIVSRYLKSVSDAIDIEQLFDEINKVML